MRRFVDVIGSFFSKKKEEIPTNVEELRNAFKARYHHFKLLLSANNKSLDIMAEMESALKGAYPFGMTFVRSRLTMVSASVWQIARHLNELAPGKYDVLYDRFKEIHIQINPFIRVTSETTSGAPLVIPMDAINKTMADQVGSKMANLGEIRNGLHLNVSNGFVITADGYRRFMTYNELETEIDRRIQAASVDDVQQLYGLSADLQQLIIRAQIPPDLKTKVEAAYQSLEAAEGKDVSVAMRSSALGEDVAGTSFAGQYRSELNVSGENILQAYKEIAASKYGLAAMTYRLNRGIRDEDVAMCVGCITMVKAQSGGVVYSRNPVNIRDDAITIHSVLGLPKSVVDGTVVPDFYVVSRQNPLRVLEKVIQSKENKLVCFPEEGLGRMHLEGDECREPSLSDAQAIELARMAIQLEDYYGRPQDIEWALDDGGIVLLQCRPLSQSDRPGAVPKPADREADTDDILFEGGLSVSPGVASGEVYIIKRDMDTLAFPEGAILVAEQALPRWATTLNRAAAAVIEQGSMAGHLANVAREFDVPGLFGVENATRRFHEGQLITVDADGQRIYAGRVEALIGVQSPPKNLMKDSPVYKALEGVAQYVTPLNLLDPDAIGFRPENCQTFHDITRFCHEKAVHEMFQFGKSHRFPERSAKQLFYDVPMQWFVLNLDDGFKEEVPGKYVKMENIVCIPMLAIWEGIVSTPWEGPPPVDGKGFLSVMFQATTNRALNTGVRSSYANRNYFMISKHYLSLNSRFGFHFSTVEALLSERVNENYINFQFKGGAADFERRLKRVHFVREILERHGFRVEVRSDTLIARLENHEENVMKARLKILGYLIIHTRQLDMVMANDARVNYYRSKIKKDIEAFSGP